MKSHKGFTLVEVIVILAVIAILAAIAVPVALRIFERTAEDATRTEMDNIKKAMIGDLQKLQSSFRNDFGYLGDIGCLPSIALGGLDRLLTASTLPTPYSFDSVKQAGAGWKGPYITGTAGEDFTKDQLGNSYVYTPVGGVCPLTATVTSNGPDGLPSTADDITVDIVANETTATVRGTVKNTSGAGLASVPVEFYSAANNGVLTTTSGTTDASGNYSFSSAPFGPRAVNANPTLVLVLGSVIVSGGGNRNVEFDVTNYSGSSVTVASINVVTCPGAVRLDDIEFATVNVESPNVGNNPCGTPITLAGANTVFNANPTPPASVRVVVDSPDTQLPDLTLRGGFTRHIGLLRFEDAGGAVVNMSGKTLTVTFNLTVGGPATMTVVTP